MDIKEVKALQQKLERDIYDLLISYTHATGLYVDDIEIIKSEFITGERILNKVITKVTL